MSADFDADDLARLLALEHAWYAMTLASACNFAHLTNTTPPAAVAIYREAIESAIYDAADTPAGVRRRMREHLKRMFDHVAMMAESVPLEHV